MAIEAASSSSIWMNMPPTVGTREAKRSTTSVEGVIGYPAAKRAPAASAPSQQAWSPSMKCVPVRTPRGSAFMCGLLGRGNFGGIDCEVGAIHAAEVAAAALLRLYYMWRVIALGVECGGKRKDFGRTKLHAKAAGFAALNDDGNSAF